MNYDDGNRYRFRWSVTNVQVLAGISVVAALLGPVAKSSAYAGVIHFSNFDRGTVSASNGTTTTTLISGLNQPMGIEYGPDGDFFVGEQQGRRIGHYSSSGALIGSRFTSGLYYTDIARGPDGLLYAAASTNFSSGHVERFHMQTHAATGSSFATTSNRAIFSQPLSGQYFEGIAFGPDGNLYAAASSDTGAIQVYQGPFGAQPGAFIRALPVVRKAIDITFGPDGALYASEVRTNRVLRYDGTIFQPFATTQMNYPAGLTFDPAGNLFVGNFLNRNVVQFQGPGAANPGAFVGVHATASNGGVSYVAAPVPEPGSIVVLSIAGLAVGSLMRFRQRKRLRDVCVGFICVVIGLSIATQSSAAVVYYSSQSTGQIRRTDGATTNTIISGLSVPRDIALGPDGHLYVAEELGSRISRYDLTTGQRVGQSFATEIRHIAMQFGDDGLLYTTAAVPGYQRGVVERWNGVTGLAAGGPLAEPGHAARYTAPVTGRYYEGMTIASDGRVYCAGWRANTIDIYQGPNEPSPGALLSRLSGGLNMPVDLEFGPDGALYVSDFGSSRILRFNGTTFQPFSSGVFLGQPIGIEFDEAGVLFVANFGAGSILRLQGPSGSRPGALIDVFARAERPASLWVVPEPDPVLLMLAGLGMVAIATRWRRLRRRSACA